MSNIIAFVSVGVSIDMSISGGGSSIGISISFTINITMFAALPDSYQYVPSKLHNNITADDYLKSSMVKLKKIYKGWEDYMQLCQREMGGVVFKSMDEVQASAAKIITRRNDYVSDIFALITDIDKKLNDYKNCDDNVKEKFLVALSNCYQALRDLTVTFYIGDQFLEIDVLMPDEILAIRDKLLNHSVYSKYGIIEKLQKRRHLSESIIDDRKKLSDLTASLSEYEKNIELLTEKLEFCRKLSVNEDTSRTMVTESTSRIADDYRKCLERQQNMLRAKINELSSQRDELDAAAAKSLFGKKKLFAQKDVVENYISTLTGKVSNIEKQISEISRTFEIVRKDASSGFSAMCATDAVSTELADYKKKQEEVNAQLPEISKEVEVLVEDYKNLMKTWPKL